MKLYAGISLCLMVFQIFCLDKTVYQFSQDLLDVVIVAHEKDKATLTLVVESIKKYIKHRSLIIISQKKLIEDELWFDEALFPFTKKSVALEIFNNDQEAAKHFIQHPKSRIGWIYQQLCKLYALFVIPDISDNILVVDADTIFLRDISFQNENGEPYFNVGTEYHPPYFQHIARTVPSIKKVYEDKSGITHHMLLQKCIMQDLLDMIQNIHHKEPWKAICHCIDHGELYRSCLSEYELYFNFACMRTDQIHIRPLRWANISLKEYNSHRKQYHLYDYVSCHSYL